MTTPAKKLLSQLLLVVSAVGLSFWMAVSSGFSASAKATKHLSRSGGQLVGVLSGASPNAAVKEMKDGSGFIEKMYAAADLLNDYSFDYRMTVYKSDKTVIEGGDFFFKKPKLMRLEVTEGKRDGAVAVLSADGRVRAKLKGMGFLSMVSLAPYSSFLRSANGYPMVDSDFLSLAQALRSYLREGVTSKVTAAPVSVATLPHAVHILEMYKHEQLWKRVYVDLDSHLPLEWYDYDDNGKLYALSTWHNFKSNLGLSDQLFTIKGDK
ncbi:MAG TPA: hypothetical protein V6D17_23735 [Candidatus Obscuribacterales bacterium]